MRRAFADAMLSLALRENLFFLSGDLGFMALEEVREAFGSRFINTGVAEQNMVGVAAGLIRGGCSVFIYSIAPFCYARPFEQIRNDICLNNLPVCLVGNGGGYAYGYMGPTHHALEDCAAMCALGVRVLVPAFDSDISALVDNINQPSYMRLGYEMLPADVASPPWAPWRRVLEGQAGALVALGPLAGLAWASLINIPASDRPAVWAACELPLGELPPALISDLINKPLYVIEEHVAAGGLGMQLSLALLGAGVQPSQFTHRTALGYLGNRFGSQEFHRAQCGLDAQGILKMIERASE